jgi:hypothetical protein
MPKKKTIYSTGHLPKSTIPLDTVFNAQTVGLINQLHDANTDKNFVQRVVEMQRMPYYNTPRIRNNDGSFSTHKMMSGETDDRGIVFPTVVQNPDGSLTELSPDEAFEYARANNEAITFSSPEEADWYARNYKTTFKQGGKMKYRCGGKMKYDKGGFWNIVSDYGKYLADVPLSMVGAKDVVGKDDYNTQFFKSVNDVTGTVMPIAGQVAANIVAPGIGGAMMSGIQSVGSALNPMEEQPNRPDMLRATNAALTPSTVNTPTYVSEKGGNLVNNNQMLNTFKGPSHEEGGIAIGQNNEVEGGETSLKDYIFSDTTKVPGTKVTFAQMSKRIESKYGRRQNDAMSDKAKERELQALKEIQEEVRFKEDAAAMANLADTNPQLFQQMTGSPANPTVAELMPGQQQQMVDVPMQQLKKGGKLLKNKSTILGTQSPGVTMEVIRSGRHYIDTLVAVTHNRRRRYSKGGTINIDPEKKGTFTAAATKHGESVQEFASQVLANKEDYSPAMVKKANFARNSKRWKHPDGGVLINSQTAPIYSNAYASNNWGFYGSKYTPEEWAALSKSDRNSYIGDAYNDALRSLGYIPGVNNPKEKAEYDRRLIGITGVWNMEEMQKNPGLAYAYESMAGNPIYQSSIYTGEAASGFIYDYPLESKYPTELSTDASKIQSYAMPRYQYVEKLNPVQQSNQNVTESTPPWITDNLYNPNGNTTAQSLQPSTLGTPSSSLNTLINPELTVTNNPKLVYTPISPETDVNVPDDINTKAVVDEMVKSGEVKQRLSGAYTPTTGGNESSITPGAMIGMGIQGAGLLAKGILLGKRNKYMPAEYTPVAPVSFERVNAREPLAQSKSAFAGANTALARNAGSTGQYLSNRIASGVGEGMQRAGIVEQVNNQNAQIQAQEATQNAQIALQNAQRKLQVGEINQQEYDSVTQAWNDYMNDVVGVGAGVTKDVLGYGAQDIALQNLDTANFDYQLINGKWTPIPKQNFGTGLKMDITTTPQTEIKRDGSVATATTTKRKGGYLKNKNKQFIY